MNEKAKSSINKKQTDIYEEELAYNNLKTEIRENYTQLILIKFNREKNDEFKVLQDRRDSADGVFN